MRNAAPLPKRRRTLLVCFLVVSSPALGCAGHRYASTSGDPSSFRTTPKTQGVNYELKPLNEHPDVLSSAPVSFEVHAQVMGEEVVMECAAKAVSAGSSCAGPCNRPQHLPVNCSLGPVTEDGSQAANCKLQILRFSQFGRVEGSKAFSWMVVMADDESLLSGSMTTRRQADGTLTYPAEAELGGRMIVFVQPDGVPAPLRLTSRKSPRFRGQVPAWPPFGLTLQLVNGPIEYYREEEINDPAAKPLMTVTANSVSLGHEHTPFFSISPRILSASRQTDGVALTWESTVEQVPVPQITEYHVYRTWDPSRIENWTRIATVQASSTSFVDTENRGDRPAQYAVAHAAAYPFGFVYEGIFEAPVTVPALRNQRRKRER